MNDFRSVRNDFPILETDVHPGKKLIYLDSAATSQKPSVVIEAMNNYYRRQNANIHRGVHALAEIATEAYEVARSKIVEFVGGNKSEELVFTRNTTESINLVANTWGRKHLSDGDSIILTEMEHHSNLVPWQMLASEKHLKLEFIPVTDDGRLDLHEYGRLLSNKPKLVAFTHMSNVLGTINPAVEIIRMAKEVNAVTLVDAAQSVPHLAVDVKQLNADFVAFSAHKMLGPTGIGALWGREDLLNDMPPFMGGGDMIKRVFLRTFEANELPHKFEAGTPAIAEAIGFGAAVEYLRNLGMARVTEHERNLVAYGMKRLGEVEGLNIIGPSAGERGGVISFTLEGVHPHDIAQILDLDGIAVRAGHHCAMPLHDRYGIPATTRASFYLYNEDFEIDQLVESLGKVARIFR